MDAGTATGAHRGGSHGWLPAGSGSGELSTRETICSCLWVAVSNFPCFFEVLLYAEYADIHPNQSIVTAGKSLVVGLSPG